MQLASWISHDGEHFTASRPVKAQRLTPPRQLSNVAAIFLF